MTDITQINQRLEESSKLTFKFPNPEAGKPSFTRSCPFFENPQIKENQSSNLVKYDVIGRSGTLFGHTGAKSREFSVNFFITLPHLQELSARLAQGRSTPSELSKEEQKEAFFMDQDGADFEAERQAGSYGKHWMDYFKKLRYDDPTSPEADFIANFIDIPFKNPEADLLVYWIDLIRSSTLTYAPNPSIGPPIIRLTHGMLYQDIPTVASKYSINVDDKSGYDVVSLLPRRIEVSLQLHEIQSNGERNFEMGKKIDRDRLSGWERVIGRIPT